MAGFLTTISSFPVVIYTILLGVVVIFWLLTIIGIVDIEILDFSMDSNTDIEGLTGLAGAMMAIGLGGVPFSIVISLLVFFSWLLSCLATEFFSFLPNPVQIAIDLVAMIIAFAISIPLSARIVKPMRRLFVTHSAVHNHELVGKSCRVTTNSVNEKFGQAFMEDGGAGLNLRIRAQTPNQLHKDSIVVIVEYQKESDCYQVVAAPE